MYNRYIPQRDGTYRRTSVPDRSSSSPPPQPKEEHKQPPIQECTQREESCQIPFSSAENHKPHAANRRPPAKTDTCHRKDASVDSFLHRLLPKDFDTGDLLIVILLLLMAGDCPEEQNSALLTLLLYFFM